MPRIPRTASCRRPAGSWRWNCPATSASIAASRRAARSRRITIAMIAKLIAHAPTREAALDRLAAALDRTVIAGPRSNVAFLAAFAGRANSGRARSIPAFIDRNLAALGAVPHAADLCRRGARRRRNCLRRKPTRESVDGDAPADEPAEADSPWAAQRRLSAWRHALAHRAGHRSMARARSRRSATAQTERALRSRERRRRPTQGCSRPTTRPMSCATAGRPACASRIFRRSRRGRRRRRRHQGADAWQGAGGPRRVGDRVAAGQRLAVIEAMKMEHTLRAPFAGVVTAGSGRRPVRKLWKAPRSW